MCRATAGRLRSWLYDATSERVERGGLAALRRDLVGRAHGRTLEIVAGTGANVRFSPATASPLVLTSRSSQVESPAPPRRPPPAGRASPQRPGPIAPIPGCRVRHRRRHARAVQRPEPGRSAGRGAARASAGGLLLFIEHVRSEDSRIARRQTRWRRMWRAIAGGCEPNRDTTAAITAAGFDLTELRRGRMPAAPAIVRPLVIGSAMRRE